MAILQNLVEFLHNQKSSQITIFGIALVISCFLVGNMGANTSDIAWIKIVCASILIFAEVVGQFSLSKGKYYYSHKSRKCYPYFIVFGLYVLIFSIPSGVGFFTYNIGTSQAI